MPIPPSYDEQHRNILRSLAKYIERNNPHHPPFETIYNDPALLHRYVAQMRVNWLEVSSAVNIDRNRAYHWYYETHLRKIIDAKVSFEDKEIIRDMILRGISDKSIMMSDFQAKIKSKMSREYHRAEFTMTYNNILRSKVVKMAMMKAGITLSGKKVRPEPGEEFSSRKSKGSTMMYSGNSPASSPNYVAYNGQKTHSVGTSSTAVPQLRSQGTSQLQSPGALRDGCAGSEAHTVGYASTTHSRASTPGYYSPLLYGVDGTNAETSTHANDAVAQPAFSVFDIPNMAQAYYAPNTTGVLTGLEAPGPAGYYFGNQTPALHWYNSTSNQPGDYNFTPLSMFPQIGQDRSLYGCTDCIPPVSVQGPRGGRGYEGAAPAAVGTDQTPVQVAPPFSSGAFIESISSVHAPSTNTDDHGPFTNGLSYSGTSMSCNPSINIGYTSGTSNAATSTSNMGMCFPSQMSHVPSYLGLLPNSVQQVMPFAADIPFTAALPYGHVGGVLGQNKNDTPLSFGETDHFYPQQAVKMPLEFLDGFSTSRIGMDKPDDSISMPSAGGDSNQPAPGYPGALTLSPYIGDNTCSGEPAHQGTGEARFRGNDTLAEVTQHVSSDLLPKKINKDDFPWDQLGEKLRTLQD